MHSYLNVKPTYSPTLLSYNGTRSSYDIWNDPNAPMLLVMLLFLLISFIVLCYCIKEKCCPNMCWVSSHPTELSNRIIRRPVRVEPRPTIEELTRQVDILTNVLIELVQDKNSINDDEYDEKKTEISQESVDV